MSRLNTSKHIGKACGWILSLMLASCLWVGTMETASAQGLPTTPNDTELSDQYLMARVMIKQTRSLLDIYDFPHEEKLEIESQLNELELALEEGEMSEEEVVQLISKIKQLTFKIIEIIYDNWLSKVNLNPFNHIRQNIGFTNQDEETVVENIDSGEESFSEYFTRKIKELTANSSKKVYGLGYCEKCTSTTSQGIENTINGPTIIKGKEILCQVYFFDESQEKVINELLSIIGSEEGSSGEYISNLESTFEGDKSLVALINPEKIDSHNPFYKCTNFLNSELNDLSLCGEQEINKPIFDLLYESITTCLKENAIQLPVDLEETIKTVLKSELGKTATYQVDINSSDQLISYKSPQLSASENADYKILISKNNEGKWKMTLQVQSQHLTSIGYSEADANEIVGYLEELFNRFQVNFCDQPGPDCAPNALNFLQVINVNVSHIPIDGMMHPSMWDDNAKEQNIHHLLEGYHLSPIVGGGVDGITEEVLSIPLLVKTFVTVIADKEQQEAFSKLLTAEGINKLKDAVLDDLDNTFNEPDKTQHLVTKASVQLVLSYYVLLGKAVKGLSKYLDNVGELAEKLEGSPQLSSYLRKVVVKENNSTKALRVEKLLAHTSAANVEKLLKLVPEEKLDDFIADISENATLAQKFIDNPEWVNHWNSFKKAGLDDLARNPVQLQKFDDLVKSNSLGLDAKGLEDLLSAPKVKGLTWDNPDGVLDAVKRASDGNISDLNISHKKFPESGSDNFVLRNAKQYQAEASGDAALSFNKGGVSFDDIASDGKLVDRKYGHSSSIFDKVDDDLLTVYEVKNQSRAQSILDQAQRQLNAVGGDGSKLRWEISTADGAGGIKQLFEANSGAISGIADIEVIHVTQKTIK